MPNMSTDGIAASSPPFTLMKPIGVVGVDGADDRSGDCIGRISILTRRSSAPAYKEPVKAMYILRGKAHGGQCSCNTYLVAFPTFVFHFVIHRAVVIVAFLAVHRVRRYRSVSVAMGCAGTMIFVPTATTRKHDLEPINCASPSLLPFRISILTWTVAVNPDPCVWCPPPSASPMSHCWTVDSFCCH